MINPYRDVDWSNDNRIVGVSHIHLTHQMTGANNPQSAYDELYSHDVRAFAVSRYRPSLITYPFDYDNGKFTYVANPFDATMPLDELKSTYGYEVSIEDDVIGIPNAEHVYPLLYIDGNANRWTNVHINGLGSTYESGLVPADNGYRGAGLDIDYTTAIDNMVNNLVYQDGGGVIINHPVWTKLNTHVQFDMERFVRDCLDYNPNVLGTDLIEDGRYTALEENTRLIDNILSTGRRCWIFCQGDWTRDRGFNVLLIPNGITDKSELEYESLKAYREGRFYGRVATGSGLELTDISFENGIYSIEVQNADVIEIISDGEKSTFSGESAHMQIPSDAKYIRACAFMNRDNDPNWVYKDTDIYKDAIFTNPIMINPSTWPYEPMYDRTSPIKNANKPFDMLYWG